MRELPDGEDGAQNEARIQNHFEDAAAFTVTAIFVLALGVCASIAIFAFVDAALLKPLPYREPARLV